MPNPYRLLAAGVFAAFSVAAGGHVLTLGTGSAKSGPAPSLLPSAHANPAEVGFQDTLRSGETLSQLLLRSKLADDEARVLLAELQQHHDPRRMRPGSVIAYRKSFVDGSTRGMELRLDADRTLTMQHDGSSWRGTVEEVPVRPDTVVLVGSVQSSLYAALLGGEGTDVPEDERRRVADILAERIFAWQIDFSRDLRSGDEFRILYERLVRPDGTARTGKVLSVQFRVNERDYEAYAFHSDDHGEDYYDRDGESLRRAFLRAPLEFRRISSAFSKSRFHPILKTNRPHHGIDYAATSGTPVRAVGDGVIRRAGSAAGYGNLVEIGHARGYSSRYAHLRAFGKGIRPGARVKQGDLIGYVGATGLATAPHLHYEFHSGGRPVDPNSIRHLVGEPLPNRYLPRFRELVALQVVLMDRLTGGVLLADAGQDDRSTGGN